MQDASEWRGGRRMGARRCDETECSLIGLQSSAPIALAMPSCN